MPYPPNLCASVTSVGGYLSKRFLWVLRILWEDAVVAWLVHFLLGWCSWDSCTPCWTDAKKALISL